MSRRSVVLSPNTFSPLDINATGSLAKKILTFTDLGLKILIRVTVMKSKFSRN